MRRQLSPDGTQVFHSELIQGDILGFSCEHSFTRDTMGLSEWHLQHRIRLVTLNTQLHVKLYISYCVYYSKATY